MKMDWNSFGQRSATITSIASVVIAGCALYLTIHYASVDREYKELTIRPALAIAAETNDFHVSFVNTGPGAAVVQNIATKFHSDKCLLLYRRPIRSDDVPGQAMVKVYEMVLKPIDEYFADPLAQLEDPNDIWDGKYPKLYTRTLTPGQIISPKEEFVIFQPQKEQLETANKRLATMNADTYNRIMRRFSERALSIPYYVDYCSLTGVFCARQIESACGSAQ